MIKNKYKKELKKAIELNEYIIFYLNKIEIASINFSEKYDNTKKLFNKYSNLYTFDTAESNCKIYILYINNISILFDSFRRTNYAYL